MTAADALRAAREAGCVVSIDGGDLDLVGPDDVMAGIAAVLKPIKADILDMLRADPSHGIAYHLITDIAEARQALASMQGQWCALDLETFCPTPELVALPRKKCWSDTLFEARKREAAPLDPLIAEARLLQVAVVDSPVVIIDVPAVGRLSGLKTEIEALTAVGFNSVFEMAFLRAAGINVVLDDVKLADHVMGFAYDPQRGLREVARNHLRLELPKHQQRSDWGQQVLSDEQLRYAAADAWVTLRLWQILLPHLDRTGTKRAYGLNRAAQYPVMCAQFAGMLLDRDAHAALTQELTSLLEHYRGQVTASFGGRNPNSTPERGAWIEEAVRRAGPRAMAGWRMTPSGKYRTTNKRYLSKLATDLLLEEDKRIILDHYIPYRRLETQVNNFGASLAQRVHCLTGRIHPQFRLCGARTGRMSCRNPNLQQMPKRLRLPDGRDVKFRALFNARLGYVFNVADYNGIELRVCAELAHQAVGISNMREVFARGEDLHKRTASGMLGIPIEQVDSLAKQKAKPVNFGAIYGISAAGLVDYARAFGQELTVQEAQGWLDSFFREYPEVREWQNRLRWSAQSRLEVRTQAGRVRRWKSRDGGEKHGFRVTEAYNTPVQGSACEGLLAALALVTERLERAGLDSVIVAIVHDEIVLETAEHQAHDAERILVDGMTSGMLSIFPNMPATNLVEAVIATSWAEEEKPPPMTSEEDECDDEESETDA